MTISTLSVSLVGMTENPGLDARRVDILLDEPVATPNLHALQLMHALRDFHRRIVFSRHAPAFGYGVFIGQLRFCPTLLDFTQGNHERFVLIFAALALLEMNLHTL